MIKICTTLLLLMMLGCASELESIKGDNERRKMQYEACIKLGGAPIENHWTKMMDRRDFPPVVVAPPKP